MVFLLMSLVISQGDIYVGISTYGKEQMDLILMPFSSSEDLSETACMLENVVKSDLLYSLYFSIVPWDETGVAPEDFMPANWDKLKSTGAEALAAAVVSRSFDGISLKGFLLDIQSENIVFEKDYRVNSEGLRSIAHEFSDDIVWALTGERGVFSTKIAYSRRGGSSSGIRVCDYDGYNDQSIVSNGSVNIAPTWDFFGKIFFTSYFSGKPEIVTIESGRLTSFVSRGDLQFGGEFSPDGSMMAFAMTVDGNTDIYITEVSSGILSRVTNSPSIECSPTWSPSGKEIAFTSDMAGYPQIFACGVDGVNTRRITRSGFYNTSPAWSPRGDRILFVGEQSGSFQIFSVSPTGENQKQLTAVGDNEDPSWSPDGLHIVFSSDRSGSDKLYTMNFDGTYLREIISSPGSAMPAWSK
ncbi:PD40 domain-containing protein [candidate division WOR-3 bacterium]|nr:PD40 domain-containing protein [candidate division WOR-3 bacterium]